MKTDSALVEVSKIKVCPYCGNSACPGALGLRCPVEEAEYRKARDSKYRRERKRAARAVSAASSGF